MTQFFNVSDEVRDIIRRFNDARYSKGFASMFQTVNTLAVSLYSLQEDARKDVLDILRDYIVDLSAYLTTEEISILLANYSDVVKSTMWTSRSNTVTSYGWCNLPVEVPQLCQALAKCKEGSKVLIPYAGDAIFATGLPSNCQISGFENNKQMWAVAHIYLHSLGYNANLLLGEDFDKSQQYDYIFCFPPMMKGADAREVVDKIYDLARHSLAPYGEMYCILPDNFCYATSGWFDVRKIPFDSHDEYSTMVISLPAGLLYPISGVQLCLFHLKRNFDNKVVLVNTRDESFLAHSRMKDGNRRETMSVSLKVDSILDTVKTFDDNYVWVGDIHQLFEKSHDLDMTPSRYISVLRDIQLALGEQLAHLMDLIDVLPFARIENIPNVVPTIGMRELSFNYLNCDLLYDKIPAENRISDRSGNVRRILTKDSLLMGFIGGKFKVARLKGVSAARPVALKPEVVPFTIVSDAVDEDFLLRCITSEFVSKQANALAVGAAITRLKRDDYKTLQVIIPSLEEQKRLYIEDTRKGMSDADRKLIESYEEFRKDMHMKKHAIGQTLFNINNWWNLLKLARDKGNGIVDDRTELGSNRKVKVADIYTNLEIAMAKLSTQLSKFDTGYGLQTENIPLTVFVEKYISEHKSPLFEYIYDSTAHRADSDMLEVDIDEKTRIAVPTGEYILREGDPLEFAVFAPEALTIVFNNIISNACAHGFKENGTERNLIRIEILSEGTDYVIAISNNGDPIKELTPQEMLTYGLTTEHSRTTDVSKNHFGIGGYEVKKLMTEFNGDVEIISTPDEEFTVTYRLIFHNTNVKFAF